MKEKHWHYYVCSLGYGDTTDLCCGHTPAGYTVVCVCGGGGGGGERTILLQANVCKGPDTNPRLW